MFIIDCYLSNLLLKLLAVYEFSFAVKQIYTFYNQKYALSLTLFFELSFLMKIFSQ